MIRSPLASIRFRLPLLVLLAVVPALGLAMTKHLVELHGGQIFSASEGEGQGSTFTVRLPVGQRGEGEDAAVRRAELT